MRETTGVFLEPALRTLEEPYLVGARSQLEDGTWTEGWEEGRAMSMEQAIEYALSQEKPLTPPSPGSEHPSSEGSPSLTRREKEVAVLVTQGLTNRQIASESPLSLMMATALLAVLLLLAVVFAVWPTVTTSDGGGNPAIHARSADGPGGSSLARDPIHRHVKVVERLGGGSLR